MPGRRLVVCCDGTWNRPDAEHPTNVVKLARNLVNDYQGQLVYYDQGVGTEGKVDAVVGGVSGLGVRENVREAYAFLVENYRQDDQIYLIGFSRGAFTVRSLGGLIYKCGIVREKTARSVDEALERYKTGEHPDSQRMARFRERNSGMREVFFIGVWDTVGALGAPIGWLSRKLGRYANAFHDVKLNSMVTHAYHALALDERREAFEATAWEQSSEAASNQTLEQVWFPGAHSDVGGGYDDSSLSDASLEWMQEKARAAGLAFKKQAVFPVAPDPLGRMHDSSRDWVLAVAERELPTERGGALDPGLRFHSSVRDRLMGDPTYQPQSLLRGDREALVRSLTFV